MPHTVPMQAVEAIRYVFPLVGLLIVGIGCRRILFLEPGRNQGGTRLVAWGMAVSAVGAYWPQIVEGLRGMGGELDTALTQEQEPDTASPPPPSPAPEPTQPEVPTEPTDYGPYIGVGFTIGIVVLAVGLLLLAWSIGRGAVQRRKARVAAAAHLSETWEEAKRVYAGVHTKYTAYWTDLEAQLFTHPLIADGLAEGDRGVQDFEEARAALHDTIAVPPATQAAADAVLAEAKACAKAWAALYARAGRTGLGRWGANPTRREVRDLRKAQNLLAQALEEGVHEVHRGALLVRAEGYINKVRGHYGKPAIDIGGTIGNSSRILRALPPLPNGVAASAAALPVGSMAGA